MASNDDTGPDIPDATDYVSQTDYHERLRRPYAGSVGRAINKRSERMARVLYEAPHFNAAEQGERRGRGRDYAKWVFSEESGTAEGLFTTGLELMMDVVLEPHAGLGLHAHDETEEVYYVLEGALTMTTVDVDGREYRATLGPGDAHAVRLGQSHFGTAGPDGARFIAVATRRPR